MVSCKISWNVQVKNEGANKCYYLCKVLFVDLITFVKSLVIYNRENSNNVIVEHKLVIFLEFSEYLKWENCYIVKAD